MIDRTLKRSSLSSCGHGAQGETRYLTNSSGSVLNSYVYSAYGTIVASSGSTFNKHLYGGKVGYYTDGPMSLILAGHRWYSPNLMRWTSRDPIDFQGGENVFAYADSDPVGNLDPQGLDVLGGGFETPTPSPSSRPGAGRGIRTPISGLCIAAGVAKEIFEHFVKDPQELREKCDQRWDSEQRECKNRYWKKKDHRHLSGCMKRTQARFLHCSNGGDERDGPRPWTPADEI